MKIPRLPTITKFRQLHPSNAHARGALRHWLGVKTNRLGAALLLACLTLAWPTRADDDHERVEHPPELPAPVCDNIRLTESDRISHVYALGVQIYRWNGSSWAFLGPEATLFADASYKKEVGIHYSGPTWEDSQGRRVLATPEAACVPFRGAIPWLLLQVTSAPHHGRFAHATHIQRVNTIGGTAPAEPGAFVGDVARVPYVAEYYFYRATRR